MKSETKKQFKKGKAGSVIAVKVIPRSSTPGFSEIMDDGVLKIRLASPPVDGKANEELVKIVAKEIGCKATDIEIISGRTGKNKLVAIYGFEPDIVNKIIRNKLNVKN